MFLLTSCSQMTLDPSPTYPVCSKTRGFSWSWSNNNMANQGLTYDGCNFFRQRLVLSTLSGKRVKIRNIRSKDDNPGLRDFEASFIRLMDKITNGTRIEINQTGTVLFYQPGLLYGGTVEHECNPQRSIGYYLEALLMLAPFMKTPLRATLKGVTNDQKDPSVDTLKATAIPLMKKFGLDGEGLELKVVKRGMPPGGGGEVLFSCPVRKTIRPVQLTDPGKIKRIRGTAYSVRVSPQMANRIVDSARSILNKFIPDIYIYTDHMKGANSGKSPGFGLTLVAETTSGTFLSAELVSNPQGQGDPVLPEDLGRNCAKLLLEEVYRGGCVDSTNQSLLLLYMTLGQQDVSKALLGPLSPYTIEFLRHIRDFFQIMFKMETQKQEEDSQKGGDKVLMTCVGAGFTNISKTLK
ncbi:hypothetical protein MATL_G00089360 [Megalops atlanticus]|uniref:RNA 3'-terminal phosphate cyclase-like protein n=1 Tax=Megalops atlanticus TaxID=7932 RepID=A0A9D3TE98_MEGAT|nr:hypothetical protein MATL_G00089360 [Megalops atlanticus]